MFSMMRTFIITFKTILQLEQILRKQSTSVSQETTGMLMISKKFIGESLVH